VPKAFDDLVEDQVLGYQMKEAAGRMAVAQQQVREQALCVVCVYTRVHSLAHVCSHTCTRVYVLIHLHTFGHNTRKKHTARS
jgi:hypothetical protein